MLHFGGQLPPGRLHLNERPGAGIGNLLLSVCFWRKAVIRPPSLLLQLVLISCFLPARSLNSMSKGSAAKTAARP